MFLFKERNSSNGIVEVELIFPFFLHSKSLFVGNGAL